MSHHLCCLMQTILQTVQTDCQNEIRHCKSWIMPSVSNPHSLKNNSVYETHVQKLSRLAQTASLHTISTCITRLILCTYNTAQQQGTAPMGCMAFERTHLHYLSADGAKSGGSFSSNSVSDDWSCQVHGNPIPVQLALDCVSLHVGSAQLTLSPLSGSHFSIHGHLHAAAPALLLSQLLLTLSQLTISHRQLLTHCLQQNYVGLGVSLQLHIVLLQMVNDASASWVALLGIPSL